MLSKRSGPLLMTQILILTIYLFSSMFIHIYIFSSMCIHIYTYTHIHIFTFSHTINTGITVTHTVTAHKETDIDLQYVQTNACTTMPFAQMKMHAN